MHKVAGKQKKIIEHHVKSTVPPTSICIKLSLAKLLYRQPVAGKSCIAKEDHLRDQLMLTADKLN